jgi:hypothetical protein
MSESKDLTPSEKMRAAIPAAAQDSRRQSILYFVTGLLASFLLGTCCICGIGLWWFRPQIHDNPERAKQLTTQIVDIRIPEAFQPRGTIEWDVTFLLKLRGVYYERYVGDGTLTLLEVRGRFTSEESVHRHIRQTLLEEGAGGSELVIDRSRTQRETVNISGQDVPFTFDVARDPRTNETFHLVEGSFEGKQGPVLLSLRVDDAHWKDEIALQPANASGTHQPVWVMEMLTSINAPESDSTEEPSPASPASTTDRTMESGKVSPDSSPATTPSDTEPAPSKEARPVNPPPVPVPIPISVEIGAKKSDQ